MGLDSVELLMEVEEHFSIAIPNREAEKAHTVGKLVDCVAAILCISSYDFSLRENTFSLIKTELINLEKISSDFSINSRVIDILDIKDKALITKLENKINLKLPGIYFKPENSQGILVKLKEWFSFTEDINFEEIPWKRFIDFTLAKNIEKGVFPAEYKSKYEIYLAIMRMTVDKIGVAYAEIGLEKSFTDDLGID